MAKSNFREKVFEAVKKIPLGYVSTYGSIALQLGKVRGAREVGWMLHSNDSVDVPCHRVVDRTGRLAPNFGGPSLWSLGATLKSRKAGRSGDFNGASEQKRRLEAEGVRFVDEMHVDLERCLWQS